MTTFEKQKEFIEALLKAFKGYSLQIELAAYEKLQIIRPIHSITEPGLDYLYTHMQRSDGNVSVTFKVSVKQRVIGNGIIPSLPAAPETYGLNADGRTCDITFALPQ